jgi:hypothetical protein
MSPPPRVMRISPETEVTDPCPEAREMLQDMCRHMWAPGWFWGTGVLSGSPTLSTSPKEMVIAVWEPCWGSCQPRWCPSHALMPMVLPVLEIRNLGQPKQADGWVRSCLSSYSSVGQNPVWCFLPLQHTTHLQCPLCCSLGFSVFPVNF